jgi:cytochrome c oxidase assembly factor CtaG
MSRTFAFAGGCAAVAATVLPPLATISERLFSAHMAQHLLIIVVAAPLFVVSRVFTGLTRTAVGSRLTRPVAAWCVFVAVFLFWHWPASFQWAAERESTRLLEHATILFASFLFWSVALSERGQDWLSYGARALMVMTAAVATDLPGVIMVFSPRAICTMPGEDAVRWGLTALQDQQIAGLLMWVPANIVFFGIATWLFARWISTADRRPCEEFATP